MCIGEVQSRYLPLEKSNFYSLPIDYSKRKLPQPTPIEVNLNFDVAEFVNIDDRRNVSNVKLVGKINNYIFEMLWGSLK